MIACVIVARVAYRDDVEALRARVEQLERENSALRREKEALRAGSAAAPGEASGMARVLGGPLVASFDHTIEGELPASAHELLLELLRESYGALGEAQVIGGTLTWRLTSSGQRWIEVLVSAREGRTRVHITEHLGGVAAMFYGGILGGAGLGGAGALVPLLHAVEPVLGAALAPLWVAGTFAVARAGYARGARRRIAAVEALGDRVAQQVERAIASAGPKVRVAPPAAADEDEISEDLRDVATPGGARTSRA